MLLSPGSQGQSRGRAAETGSRGGTRALCTVSPHTEVFRYMMECMGSFTIAGSSSAWIFWFSPPQFPRCESVC